MSEPGRTVVPGGGGVMAITAWPGPRRSGPRLATAGVDGTVRRWDALTGEQLPPVMTGHDGNVWAIVVGSLSDGRRLLASAGRDGTVRRWDAETGEPFDQPIVETADGVRALTFWSGPDGPALAAVGLDGTIRRWNAETGKPLGDLLGGHDRNVRSLVSWIAPDGRPALASGGADGTIRCWDALSGDVLTVLEGHQARIRAITTWTAAGGAAMLGSADEAGVIRCWNLADGTLTRVLLGHQGTVQALAPFSTPDRRPALASTGDDGTVRRWDLSEGVELGPQIRAHNGVVWAMTACLGPTGPMLVSCGDDDMRRWDAITGEPVGGPMTGHAAQILALTSWRRRSGTVALAFAGDDLTVRLLDPTDGTPIGGPLTGHIGPVRAVVSWVRPDRRVALASAGDDGTLRLWDPDGGARLGDPLTGHTGPVQVLAAAEVAGRAILASAGDDTTVRLWDPVGRAALGVLSGHTGPIRALATAPADLAMLASAGDDGTVRVWDVATRGALGPTIAHGSGVRALALWRSAGGEPIVAAGGADGTIHRWHARSGAPVGAPLTGHTGAVAAIAGWTLPDGRRALVSAGEDGLIHRWDAASGAPIGDPLAGHTGTVRTVAVWREGDGRAVLASGGADGSIRVWDLVTGTELARFDFAVQLRALSDMAASVDLLGRAQLAAVIGEQVHRPEPAADPGPTVVTVEGPWGSGKTTLLNLIRNRLGTTAGPVRREPRFTIREAFAALAGATPDQPAKPLDPRVALSVWFDPWMHQTGDQVWAGLVGSIVDEVNTRVLPHEPNRQRFWFHRNAGKLDRYALRRALVRRTVPPILRLAVVPTAATVLLGLAGLDQRLTVAGVAVTAATAALVVAIVLGLAGLLQWAWRYRRGAAAAYLPGELFQRPVASGTLATLVSTTTEPEVDPLLRDPLVRARSGTLYLYQHDTRELLRDLKQRGYDLVVFVDDLDRCSSSTTAQVFEAINLFLADPSLPGRFVIGLDPGIVAAHIDLLYRDLGSAARPQWDDAGPGWAFLRKLVQLPVVLPGVTDDGMRRFVETVLHTAPPEPDVAGVTAAPPPGATAMAAAAAAAGGGGGAIGSAPARTAPTPPAPPTRAAGVDSTDRHRMALEASPDVSALMHERLAAQPQRTIREAKRLINVWQLYARLLSLTDPLTDPAAVVARGRRLVILAEIVTRWPALQQPLHARLPEGRGLATLAAAADDRDRWVIACARLGLPGAPDEGSLRDLRALLCAYEGVEVARLAAVLF